MTKCRRLHPLFQEAGRQGETGEALPATAVRLELLPRGRGLATTKVQSQHRASGMVH